MNQRQDGLYTSQTASIFFIVHCSIEVWGATHLGRIVPDRKARPARSDDEIEVIVAIRPARDMPLNIQYAVRNDGDGRLLPSVVLAEEVRQDAAYSVSGRVMGSRVRHDEDSCSEPLIRHFEM